MRQNEISRRRLIQTILGIPVLTATSFCTPGHMNAKPASNSMDMRTYKLSLNAYSFNEPLRKGSLTLDDLLEFCAGIGFDAVDLTGYYFPGYPTVPPDDYIYHIKQKAFLLGLSISGTGVRNDFTTADENKRKEDITLVKNWIVCASKLGAPVIRIFSGTQNPQGYSRQQILEWMIKDIKECVEFGKQHGVIVGIQNHHDFIKTADETKTILQMVNSDWFGLILDIGSYRGTDPYSEIASMAPSAVSWQLKENMFVNGIEIKTDVDKIIDIVRASGYRGYLPIETLGAGDPKTKVSAYLEKVKRELTAKNK